MKEWLKKYWYIPTFLFVLVSVIFFAWQGQTSHEALLRKHNEQVQAHLKEIKKLEEASRKKEIELKTLNKEYQNSLKTMLQKYEDNLDLIAKKQTKSRVSIVKDAHRDPNTLTEKIAETFGVPYYEDVK
jgi:predicted metal-dependent hydrolase